MTRSKWVLLLTILGSALFIRTWKLASVPGGFFCDEASLGYNAWAISHYGIDETGQKMPLYARSLGVQKNPVFVYSSMLPIRLFGLTESSVRLTSAVYGTLTIAGLFWLVYQIHGYLAAIIATFFLSILPWNFHFSRIAFELITWPCLFIWGLAFLLFAIRRGKWVWLVAGFILGLSLHTYVMAISFLPLFLFFFALIYLKKLIVHWRWVLLAILIFSIPATLAVNQHLRTSHGSHYSNIGWWPQTRDLPVHTRLDRLLDHYKPFFSTDFLVKQGDSNPRHSLRHHGMIYQSLFYLSIAGIILGFYPLSRYYFILLFWTLLYPLGAALTIDRSASRSIIGSPLAPLWAAFALTQLFKLFNKIPIRPIALGLQTTTLILVCLHSSHEASMYFQRYFTNYNRQSAAGLYGFQYGYREVLRVMESQRHTFDQLILTAHNVNEPYIFCLFYNQIDPRYFSKTGDFGYKITRSWHFNKYSVTPPTLFAIQPDELVYFDDYILHHSVLGYDNSVVFYIIEPLARRPSLYHWSLRGLWRHQYDSTCDKTYFNPEATFLAPVDTLTGPAFWSFAFPDPPVVDIQNHFRESDPKYPNNPEQVMAEGVCWTYFESPESGYLEVLGSQDYFSLWLNSRPLLESIILPRQEAVRKEFSVQAGWNEWAFHSCEDVGDWYFMLTLRDVAGRELRPKYIRVAPPNITQYPGKIGPSFPLQYTLEPIDEK